jgi:hypothetical protein
LCFSSSQQLDHRVHHILVLSLGCSWGLVEKGWSVGGQRSGLSMEKWVDGIIVPMTKSFLYEPFSLFGVEMLMEVGRFSFPHSALRARGLFPSSLLSLPFSLFCLLASQVGLFPL